MVLCFIFIIYCSVYLLKGNGYLAVYIAGMVIGNSRLFKKKEIGTFLDGMTWLLQIVMFLMLGLLVNPHEMLPVMLTAVLVSVFMTFVARPLSVWLSLLPFGRKITNKSKLFISWVGIRGAAPIIFATYPVMAQVDGQLRYRTDRGCREHVTRSALYGRASATGTSYSRTVAPGRNAGYYD